MEKQEKKSKEKFIKELAALRQQLSDLEQRATNFDLDEDTRGPRNSGVVVSNQINLKFHELLEATSEAALVVGRAAVMHPERETADGY